MCLASPPPSSPSPAPHVNVTRSPGLSSTTSSRSGPMRSLGPGRSCRIATGRPALPAASRTRRTVSACSSTRAVRVVQPRDVHPRVDHREQGLRLARGGADGGDDLRAAHGCTVAAGGDSPVPVSESDPYVGA